MPSFLFHFRSRTEVHPDDTGLECRDLHHAYLEVCRTIPDMARDLLVQGQDPLACSYVICDAKGVRLMEVPFAEVLSPEEWQIRRARQRPRVDFVSDRARNQLALTSFRQMFSALNVGCVLMTPELEIVEMNEFERQHDIAKRAQTDRQGLVTTTMADAIGATCRPKTRLRPTFRRRGKPRSPAQSHLPATRSRTGAPTSAPRSSSRRPAS